MASRLSGLKDKNRKEISEGDIISFYARCVLGVVEGEVKFGIYDDNEGCADAKHLGFYVEALKGAEGRFTLPDVAPICEILSHDPHST